MPEETGGSQPPPGAGQPQNPVPPPVARPPQNPVPPPVAGQPQVQPYAQPGPMIINQMVAQKNSGLCVASMVLGILAVVFCWLPFAGIVMGILAVILGGTGIASVNKTGLAGKGMAIAGLVLGIVSLAANIIFIVVVWGIFSSNMVYYNSRIILTLLIA